MTLRRLALLASATLIGPGLLTWQAGRNNGRVIDVYAIGCVTMFSAGVATWNGVESGDDMVARADRALYRAKDAGRDRIEYDDRTACPERTGDTTGPHSGPSHRP